MEAVTGASRTLITSKTALCPIKFKFKYQLKRKKTMMRSRMNKTSCQSLNSEWSILTKTWRMKRSIKLYLMMSWWRNCWSRISRPIQRRSFLPWWKSHFLRHQRKVGNTCIPSTSPQINQTWWLRDLLRTRTLFSSNLTSKKSREPLKPTTILRCNNERSRPTLGTTTSVGSCCCGTKSSWLKKSMKTSTTGRMLLDNRNYLWRRKAKRIL